MFTQLSRPSLRIFLFILLVAMFLSGGNHAALAQSDRQANPVMTNRGKALLPISRIGVLGYLGEKQSVTHWAPTAMALQEAFPDRDIQIKVLDIDELDSQLAAGELDFVITNPGNYAELEYRHHISRIATADSDLPVASTLVTTQDFRNLGDLAGKRLAIIAPEGFGGFQLIWLEMQNADRSLPGKVKLVSTGFPMQQVADAVLDGRADAAVLRTCTLEMLQRQNPERYGALHSFAERPDVPSKCATSSPIYPDWPFAKAEHTDPDFAKRVAVILLSMQAGNLWTVPSDYQSVHDVLRQLQIGPYARTGPISLRQFVEDYGEWLIVLAGALIFWAIYSVRIETLVRRRTKALNETNAKLLLEMAVRKKAEEADRRHLRELEHVARLSILGEMATSIAHELNQPLAAISNYAQGCLLRLRGGTFTPKDMEHASEEIAQQAERAAMVIRRIRAFVSKHESQLAPVEIADLIGESSTVYAVATRQAGVKVAEKIDPDLPVVLADRIQLQQVILNLIQNAVDAMADTPLDRRLVIIEAIGRHEQDETEGSKPGACITVRDFGKGMGEEGLGHFAEAFYTTKPDGIGLGLALSRSIIEAHGGWMRAEQPTDGPGLIVRIWLPRGE